MGRFGLTEILLIVLAVLLLFGVKRLPEIGTALGKALKDFRKALKGEQRDDSSGNRPE